MSKTVLVHAGSPRPCSPACALLYAPRCLATSRFALPVHGVFTTCVTTPELSAYPGTPIRALRSATRHPNATSAHLASRHHCHDHSQCPPVQPSCRLGLAPEPLKDVPRLAQPGRGRRAHLGPVRIPPGELGLDQRPDVDPVDGHVHDLAVDVDVDELGTASPRGSCRRRGTGRHSGRWPRTASR
jgi:hypothetical protein